MDIHTLARRPLINNFTLGVSSFINCAFLGAKKTVSMLTNDKPCNSRDNVINFRTDSRNRFDAFGENGIRRGNMAAVRSRRLRRSRTFPAVKASKFNKCEKKKKKTTAPLRKGGSTGLSK